MAACYTDKATEILEQYKSGTFPVHVVSIAEKLGITVFADSNYPDNGNGHIELGDDNSVSIVVNDNQSAERKTFTIAHEIAHYLMDMDYLKQHKSIDRDGDAADETYRMRERRANSFAAELLMPESEFVRQWISLRDLKRVADCFGVSKAAATWRALNVGILKAE